MKIPLNQSLYDQVKRDADKKFREKTSAYKSTWIVHEYQKRGGQYHWITPDSGLKRWYEEKWVDLNRPIYGAHHKVIGYEPCGRKSSKSPQKYPVCRPTYRVSQNTPVTYSELSPYAIRKAKHDKNEFGSRIYFKQPRVRSASPRNRSAKSR